MEVSQIMLSEKKPVKKRQYTVGFYLQQFRKGKLI